MSKTIKLYHFTDQDIKQVKPSFFGANAYTARDARFNIKRAFFYTTRTPKEDRFRYCQYCYIVTADRSKLYDLRADKSKLVNKYNGDIDAILRNIKKNYDGLIYNVGFDIVCLFKTADVDRIIKRKDGQTLKTRKEQKQKDRAENRTEKKTGTRTGAYIVQRKTRA